MDEYIKKIKGNKNFIYLSLAFIFLVIAFINPKLTMKKDISNYIFVVDITQSMLTQDALLNGKKVSRLKYAKDISQKVLEQLPCKTKVSIGMFAGVSVAATYTPIEVCENFSAINETIERLDWRSVWAGNTRLRASMINLARLIRSFPESAQVVYFTDGEEAPKLHAFNTEDLNQFQGANNWLFVGIGSDEGTPIPKYDNKNQLIGYWSNESFALQPGVAQISAQNAGGRDNNVSSASYDRYLSRLDEKYLKSLAQEVKGNYVNGSDLKEILSAMEKQPSAWRDNTEVQLRNIFSFFALLFFIMQFFSINGVKSLLKIKYGKS
ncbi:VWA domain-containing protein [Methylophilaceae bacterium]|jgi:mxaL protein|nr:VWA domain-containing protein [Methylophilaceae bacterium]